MNLFFLSVLLEVLTFAFVSNGESSSSKMLYTFIPAKADSWWKIYVNGSTNHSGTPYIAINDGITLKLKGNVNDSVMNIEIINSSDESDGSESVFNLTEDSDSRDFRGNETVDTVTSRSGRGRNRKVSGVGDLVGIPELNLVRRLVTVLPPFVPSSSNRVTNQQCLRDSQHYLKELDNFALWALKMYDSSAKLPSGLLNGNVNQYGDIDQCLSVRAPSDDGVIKGQYCLATLGLQLSDPDRPALQQLRQLLMSHGMFTSKLDDPGHRVPRFSAIHWALCIPSSCTSTDVQLGLSDVMHRHTEGTGIRFQVRVQPEMCQVKEDKLNLPTSTLLVAGLFISIVIFAIIATAFDPEWRPTEEKLSSRRKLVQAFSLRKNVLALFSLTRSSDDIEAVHGIRAINAILLLIAHKCMALFFNPYLDRTTMAENLGKSWTGFARGACIYTDPFIMMSGLLTSYSFYKELERRKKLDVPREYMSRLMRLMPNLITLILFCTFILPFTGTGPLWNQVVTHHSDICKITWWRNLFFIHNYFGFENMCLTHTHHLGIDTQLFLFSPFLVYMVWRWPRFGLSALTAIAAASTALRYNVTYTKQLSHFIVFGSSVTQLFKTANMSYILPAHRATVYVMGIALGFGLRYCGRDFKIKKVHLTLGWTAAIVCFYMATIAPSHMASSQYVYNPSDAANYAAIGPITWCLFTAWIIFISYIRQGGLLSKALSWRGFLVTTRLSYALYLLQFPIFFYTVGRNRVSNIYSIILLLDVPELLLIVAACIILTLLIDLPFQNIRNIVLRKPK